ncbi:MAG TPA: hypothetical protein VFH78_08850 [Candidatus Thermoplasmatota archaeon]|nr:hypothetical protein [Candidatus Thermoplasmatota archaeon]
MGRSALLVALLFVAPALAVGAADACAVPCGRIYPIITIQLDTDQPNFPLASGVPVDIPARLTYRFDMVNEGYTVATPNQPIDIRFEYPRRPDWVTMAVTPEVVRVDVTNPTYVQPDTSNPTSPQAQYVFTVPITITVTLAGQAILRDGYDYHKLLVFAKSSESGLYQAGYGIKEIRVVPENALHESDVAGSRDVFTASPLPALAPTGGAASFAGTTVTLTPPSGAKWWEPAQYAMTVEPVPSGRMVFAVHDETGALVASTAPLAAAAEARMNVTLAKPGRHTATLTLLPGAGTMTPPLTYAVPFDTGALAAEGFVFGKSYVVTSSETVPAPLASDDDPLTQFERDVPFWVFETAQGVSATVTLKTPTPLALPVEAGRSAANLQFSIHDPDGNMLQAGSVDPTKPTWGVRVGSLPTDGWYVLRIRGVGAPGAAYDTRVEVTYAQPPQARNRADGAPDATGPLLAVGGVNLTLPVDALAVWAPSDITPALAPASSARYSVTVYDANGTLAYASGVREGAASFSAPAPGTYRAYVYAEPTPRALPFSPVVRAFTFDVGADAPTVASTFRLDDGFEAPLAATDTLLGFHAVRVLPGAAAPTLSGADLVDADGNEVDGATPGTYWVRAAGRGASPEGSEMRVALEQTYGAPVTLTAPGSGGGAPASGLSVPGFAIALAVAAAGLAAVAVALYRRG